MNISRYDAVVGLNMSRSNRRTPVRLKYAVLPLALMMGVCGARAADTPTMTVSSVGDLASLFEGEFTTLPGQAAAAGAPQPTNVLYNLSKRVQVPSLGADVVYAEQHQKSPDGPTLWQRLYAFKQDDEQGAIVMTPYDFSNGQQLAGAYNDPTPLAKLEPAALIQQPGGCVVLWRRGENGFEGTLKPGSCKEAPDIAKKSGPPAITVTKTEYTEQPQDSAAAPTVFRRIH
jgi:hypothetical protein